MPADTYPAGKVAAYRNMLSVDPAIPHHHGECASRVELVHALSFLCGAPVLERYQLLIEGYVVRQHVQPAQWGMDSYRPLCCLTRATLHLASVCVSPHEGASAHEEVHD
jgi:hypothetical protein